jgi:adenylylsulfate kinase-like enzyme
MLIVLDAPVRAHDRQRLSRRVQRVAMSLNRQGGIAAAAPITAVCRLPCSASAVTKVAGNAPAPTRTA